MVLITAEAFKAIANEVLRKKPNRSASEQKKTWSAFFGTTPEVAAELWNKIDQVANIPDGTQPKYLLWALLFLRKYNNERDNCQIVGIQDEKTFRHWSWLFVIAIGELYDQTIVWNNRFINWNQRTKCLISIDGTDCPIEEPRPFDRQMYSHKLNSAGLKYEIGVAIFSDNIVWSNGPKKCGESDLSTFRSSLAHELADDEAVECDMLYKGDHRLKNPRVHQGFHYRRLKARVRARQEIVNARLKTFQVLHQTFRHRKNPVFKHGLCFRAVIVVVQTNLNHGIGRLPDVSDYDLTYA